MFYAYICYRNTKKSVQCSLHTYHNDQHFVTVKYSLIGNSIYGTIFKIVIFFGVVFMTQCQHLLGFDYSITLVVVGGGWCLSFLCGWVSLFIFVGVYVSRVQLFWWDRLCLWLCGCKCLFLPYKNKRTHKNKHIRIINIDSNGNKSIVLQQNTQHLHSLITLYMNI